MKNQFVADNLYMIANLLDLKGEIFFKDTGVPDGGADH
jgi:hypothetical protein